METRLIDGLLIPRIQRSAAPLRRSVVYALRTAIIEGRLAPGERLTERVLIEMTGVSRSVIREALRQLETEGLINVVANKGAVVSYLSHAEAVDLYAIRAALEGLAARLFTQRAASMRNALSEALFATSKAYQEGNPETILEAKNQFYEILLGGADSEMLSAMIESLQARVWRWRILGLAHPSRSDRRSAETLRGLGALVAAIQKNNAELAERVARSEVMNAGAEAMRLLRESHSSEARTGG